MEPVSIGLIVAGWVINKLIGKMLDGELQKWARRIAHLGDEVESLKKKLREISILLDTARRTDLKNGCLLEAIMDLQQAAYDTEDLLDELHYYRLKDIAEHKRDYQKHVNAPASCCNYKVAGRHLLAKVRKVCCGCGCCYCCCCCVTEREPKPYVPKFDKEDISERIGKIVEKLGHNGEVVQNALSVENSSRIADAFSPQNIDNFAIKLANKIRNSFETSSQNGNLTIKLDSPTIIGRDDEKNKIVDHLIGNKPVNENIWVLPIVGIGGSGKTALADEVYKNKKVEECFGGNRMWISVSHNMNVKDIMVKIMSILSKNEKTTQENTLENQYKIICEKLKYERVLLVVDNLCPGEADDERWNFLSKLFRGTKENGTKIMVTTRHEAFAEKIGTIEYIKLGALSRDGLKKLFDACAFRNENTDNYRNLHDLRKDFLNKLSGYPLEVKTIGAVLSKKLDFEHWYAVLNDDEWKHQMNTTESEHIMASLKISYQYLSGDLQKCFSYCSVFPKNFKFKGHDLMNLWMAQGFISKEKGNKSKVLGLNSLNELVWRGLFEKVIECNEASTTYYIMHELVHDLAKIISSNEVLTIDGSDVRTKLPHLKSIRHVSIITRSAYNRGNCTDDNFESKIQNIVEKLDIARMRTLILIGDYDSSFAKTFQNLFRKAKYLRVLRLSMNSSVIGSLLYNFSNSLLLRYLKLDDYPSTLTENKNGEENTSKEKPINNKKLRKAFRLYHLETLDISDWSGVLSLPGLTRRLSSLRCFYAKREQIIEFSNIGKLKCLEELSEFVVRNGKGFDIGQLCELKELGGSLKISNLECINTTKNDEKEKLEGKGDPVGKREKKAKNGGKPDLVGKREKEKAKLEGKEDLVGKREKKAKLGGKPDLVGKRKKKTDPEGEAYLVGKRELRDLSLLWSLSASNSEPHKDDSYAILNSLEPPPNIREIKIDGYPGTRSPHWISKDHFSKCLGSLTLINCINLDVLPPLGQLSVLQKLKLEGLNSVKKVTKKFYGNHVKDAFKSLKEMMFVNMKNWDEWVGIDECQMFLSLEKLEILHCPLLPKLPDQFGSTNEKSDLPEQSDSSNEKLKLPEPNEKPHFPNLMQLRIEDCPILKLPSLANRPKTNNIYISGGLEPLKVLSLSKPPIGLCLSIEWGNERTIPYKNTLVFPNLKDLVELTIKGACFPWESFKEFGSLKRLIINGITQNTQSHGEWVLPKSLELLEISSGYVTGQHVSDWLLHLPSLLTLVIELPNITSLEVENELSENEENLWIDEAKLRICIKKMPSLEEISIIGCENLVSLSLPHDGLSGFASLKKLTIKRCSKLNSLPVANTESNKTCILPRSLLQLEIERLSENVLSRLLSNFAGLTHLKLDSIINCKSLSMEHFDALQELSIENCADLSSLDGVGKLGSLRMLKICNCKLLAAAWENALTEQSKNNFSLRIKKLIIDDTLFLTDGICENLTALEKLVLDNVQVAKLTEAHTNSLFKLYTIRQITLDNCSKLLSLPNNLDTLQALSKLKIKSCPGIKSLPDRFPDFINVSLHKPSNQLEKSCKNSDKIKKLHFS